MEHMHAGAQPPRSRRPRRKAASAGRRSPNQPPAQQGPAIAEVPGYALSFRPGTEERDLVVTLSASDRHILGGHAFGRDVLFVADRARMYYLRDAERLARALTEWIEARGYARVLFVGPSKGGFGALLIARLCAGMRPERVFHALVFSPQVRLHPPNPNLDFPSYRKMRGLFGIDAQLTRALRRHGDVGRVGDAPNLRSVAVFATDEPTDRAEALALRGPNVVLRPVAGTFHGTMFYFMMHDRDRDAIEAKIASVYARRADDDIAATAPSRIPEVAREIMLARESLPTLNQLFDEVLATPPEPRSFDLALRSAWRRAGAALRDAVWEASTAPSRLSRRISRLRRT